MNVHIERPSARIIPFPNQPRIGTRLGGETVQPPLRIAGFGEGWYHEDAIREAAAKTSS